LPEQSVTGLWIHIDWRMAMIGMAFIATPWIFMSVAQFINIIITVHRLRKSMRHRRDQRRRDE
jgi:hypothetical protein